MSLVLILCGGYTHHPPGIAGSEFQHRTANVPPIDRTYIIVYRFVAAMVESVVGLYNQRPHTPLINMAYDILVHS
jgi:hypothetical protein